MIKLKNLNTFKIPFSSSSKISGLKHNNKKHFVFYRSQLSPRRLEHAHQVYKQRALQRRSWWQRLVARLTRKK